MVNSLNLIKFDVTRNQAAKYFQKQVKMGFNMDFHWLQMIPDYYKYFILLASTNIIFGFTKDDQTESFDYMFSLIKSKTDPNDAFFFRDYHYYEQHSSLRCIHPSVILYSQINHVNNLCHLKRQTGQSPPGMLRVEESCRLCGSPHGIQYYLQSRPDKFNFRRLERSKMTQSSKKLYLRISTMVNFSETIKSRANVYLQHRLRTFRFKFAAYKKLVLEFEKYFPYELARVRATKAPELEFSIKMHKASRLLYPKALRISPVFGGFVNERHNGSHIITLFLVQKSRNILLSNVLQPALAGDSHEKLVDHSYISQGDSVVQRSAFAYKISEYRRASPGADQTQSKRFSAYTQMVRAMLGEISSSIFFNDQTQSKRDVLSKFRDVGESHSEFKSADKVVRAEFHSDQFECRNLADQGFFERRSNLMELGNVAGNSRPVGTNPKSKTRTRGTTRAV